MVKMIHLQKQFYPPFHDWINSVANDVPAKAKVWDSFLEYSGMTDDRARAVLAPDSDPLIDVLELPGNFGLFVPRPSIDQKISISRQLVKQFTANPGDATLAEKIEATVLHELIHWALHHDPNLTEPRSVDRGTQFERAAYGREIATEPPRTFASDSEHETLGELSRHWESKGNPAAFGKDKNGGWSYGLYQIATKPGTMKKFLAFLGRHAAARPPYGGYRDTLNAAGGNPAALGGADAFKTAWRGLAEDAGFSQAQHHFCKETHYDVMVSRMLAAELDIRARSKALKDVIWSVAIQHGPNSSIPERAAKKLSNSALSDDERFIDAIYDERSRVDVYFRRSTDKVKRSVLNRFVEERKRALEMLREERA